MIFVCHCASRGLVSSIRCRMHRIFMAPQCDVSQERSVVVNSGLLLCSVPWMSISDETQHAPQLFLLGALCGFRKEIQSFRCVWCLSKRGFVIGNMDRYTSGLLWYQVHLGLALAFDLICRQVLLQLYVAIYMKCCAYANACPKRRRDDLNIHWLRPCM